MEKKEDALKEKIKSWVTAAQKRMFLEAWNITFSWDGKDDNEPLSVTCNVEYRKADIEVNLEVYKTYEDDLIRLNCYHEVAHVLLAEYVALGEERCVTAKQLSSAEEQLAEIIARIALE